MQTHYSHPVSCSLTQSLVFSLCLCILLSNSLSCLPVPYPNLVSRLMSVPLLVALSVSLSWHLRLPLLSACRLVCLSFTHTVTYSVALSLILCLPLCMPTPIAIVISVPLSVCPCVCMPLFHTLTYSLSQTIISSLSSNQLIFFCLCLRLFVYMSLTHAHSSTPSFLHSLSHVLCLTLSAIRLCL